MKVIKVEAFHVSIPMTSPFRKAGHVQHDADNALVRLETDDGLVGWGEAAAAPSLTGSTGAQIAAGIHHLADLLLGADPCSIAALHARTSAAMLYNDSAVCAIDIALHDLAGQALGVPVHRLIGGPSRTALLRSVGLNADPSDAEVASSWKDRGAGAFKVKVGIADPAHERAALRKIRDAVGPEASLAIDANGAWFPGQALQFLESVADLDLDFCEQPIAPGNISRLSAVAERSPVSIYSDESFVTPLDLIAQADAGVAGVSMKTIKMGGITGFMSAAYLARLLGLRVNVAGKTATSSIGGSALLHIGTALPALSGGIGLSNHKLVDDLVTEPVGAVDGVLTAPSRPGLGVEVDEAVVRTFVQAHHVARA